MRAAMKIASDGQILRELHADEDIHLLALLGSLMSDMIYVQKQCEDKNEINR